MPYKEITNRYAYRKGYYAGFRKAVLFFKGNKCVNCGSTEKLQIDHIRPLKYKSRTIKDLQDLDNIQILCQRCNTKKRIKEMF